MKKKNRGLVALVAVGTHKYELPDEHYELLLTASGFVGQNKINADVMFIKNFNELVEEVDGHPGTIILFSNFPPKEYFENTNEYDEYNNGARYGITKNIFTSLLKKRSDILLNIVTGAQTTALPDNDILEISENSKITVIRFEDWNYGPGFYQNYRTFIYRTLSDVFQKQ